MFCILFLDYHVPPESCVSLALEFGKDTLYKATKQATIQLSCKITSLRILLARNLHILASDLQVHAVLLAVIVCSLAFGLVSRQSHLAMTQLLLCRNPNYRSSFVERNTFPIAIVSNTCLKSGQCPTKSWMGNARL